MPRLPRVRGRQLIAALQRLGFRVTRIKGSHHILQHTDGRRTVVPVHAGETIGYGATWTAAAATEAAIVNIGYADGYLRCFAGKGGARVGEASLPLIGRVSMDLVALDCSAAPSLAEGAWVTMDYDLPTASAASGLSQYELLTGLSQRLERSWS